ncbi:MAG: ABC transporter permease [Nitrospirae bacterium]|nr:ABC transporter permease [Nitrospirota bacterium]
MMEIRFHINTAASNIARNKGINLLTIFSITVGLFLIAVTAITLSTLKSAVREWTRGFGVVVYLKDNADQATVKSLKSRIEREAGVKEARFVPRSAAMASLKTVLGEDILEGLDENPLPDSIEITLTEDRLNAEFVRETARRVKTYPGVEDVQFGEQWVGALFGVARHFTLAGTAVGFALTIGILFILSNTIKILFYRRTNEIDILKLLGATRWFIRIPFMAEGIFFGLSSGLLASMLLQASLAWMSSGNAIPFVMPVTPFAISILLVLFGGILGLAGSTIAVGRIRL